jgi:hypothetical protein
MKYLKKINEIIDDDYDDFLFGDERDFADEIDDKLEDKLKKSMGIDDNGNAYIKIFNPDIESKKDDPHESNKEKKSKKEKKKFEIGDILILTNKDKTGKLPEEAREFLLTYKKFKVIHINEKFNIDIGCILNNGNSYYFNPNRFDKII